MLATRTDRAPQLLLLDEPSLGIASRIVLNMFAVIRGMIDRMGVAVPPVEQNAAVPLENYVLEVGRTAAISVHHAS